MKIDVTDMEAIHAKVEEFIELGSLRKEDETVAILIGLMVKKASNNLKLARIVMRISDAKEVKEFLGLAEKDSFYDWVIITAYYAMYFAAQALLATKKVRIQRIRVHEATLYAFAHYFIVNKQLEEELFFLYEDAERKAEELFTALSEERKKRGQFTYERLPKANQPPAQESIKNASAFVSAIEGILKKRRHI